MTISEGIDELHKKTYWHDEEKHTFRTLVRKIIDDSPPSKDDISQSLKNLETLFESAEWRSREPYDILSVLHTFAGNKRLIRFLLNNGVVSRAISSVYYRYESVPDMLDFAFLRNQQDNKKYGFGVSPMNHDELQTVIMALDGDVEGLERSEVHCWNAVFSAFALFRNKDALLRFRGRTPITLSVMIWAIVGGDVEFLQFMWNEMGPRCDLHAEMCKAAVKAANLDALRWLRSIGCPWNSETTDIAVQMKSISALRLLRSGELDGVCPWNNFVMTAWGDFISPEIVRWMRSDEANGKCGWSPGVFDIAARANDIEMMKWLLFDEDGPEVISWCHLTMKTVAARGNLEFVQLLRSGVRGEVCEWDKSAFSYAVSSGNFKLMEFMRAADPPCPWSSYACICAIKNGDFKALTWLRSGESGEVCPIDPDVIAWAIREGRLEMLKWLISDAKEKEEDCPLPEDACDIAAKYGHVEVLRWLRSEEGGRNPWSAETCAIAAENGHIDVLMALRSGAPEMGGERCPWDARACNKAASKGRLDIMRLLRSGKEELGSELCPWDHDTCHSAVSSGNIELVKFLRGGSPEAGGERAPWDPMSCARASRAGDVDMLRLLRSGSEELGRERCPWDERSCCNAAWRGHTHVLRLLRSGAEELGGERCPWDERTCAFAAYGNQMRLLKMLRFGSEELGDEVCPWDEQTCNLAAKRGYVEIMHFLRSRSREDGSRVQCPWSAKTMSSAVYGHHRDMVKKLREGTFGGEKCPMDASVITAAMNEFCDTETIEYLRTPDKDGERCPWDSTAYEAALKVPLWSSGEGLKYLLEEGGVQDGPCPCEDEELMSRVKERLLEYEEWRRG